MADYQRQAQRFFFGGVSTLPPDALPAGKLPYGRNIRSYQEGVIQPRYGLVTRAGAGLGAAIHSIGRLNDQTDFNGGVTALRAVGTVNGELFTGDPSGSTYASVDSGYSAFPMNMVAAQPPQSPRPYLYVTNSSRMRKLTTDTGPFEVGIAQPSDPSTEPDVAVDGLKTRYVYGGTDDLGVVWIPAGTSAGSTNGTPTARVNTVIGQILYDSGSTGYASIVPGAVTNMTTGTLLSVGGERTIITDITIAIAATTVAAIIYDSGSSGFCTIQPAGSLGTGQLDAPTWAEVNRTRQISTGVRFAVPRGEIAFGPLPVSDAPRRRIRQIDFPMNCIVTLNGVETVRILSVAVGPDGTQSFRCFTSSTIGVGDTITGTSAIRVHLAGTHAAGAAIVDTVIAKTLTYPVLPVGTPESSNTRLTGGVQSTVSVNLAQFSDGTAILPDDEVHLAVRIDRLTEVTSIRAYFDVDADVGSTVTFLRNYYFYEWRASDIVSAIQGSNAADVTPLAEARQTVVTNEQLQQVQASIASLTDVQSRFGSILRQQEAALLEQTQQDAQVRSRSNPAEATSDRAITSELALGNNQWLDLRVKVRELIRVGTDPTRTLANVRAAEMLISAETLGVSANGTPLSVQPLTFEFGDLWAAGGGGPDVGSVGDPYHYRYRYRSSATGGVSNPSPEARGGVIPRRQSVSLTAVPSADPQVDKIDWFRMGSALTQYTYVGTGENSSAAFSDTMPDTGLDGGQILAYDNFQPWPTLDLPRTGVCDIAGTAVRRVSGDSFNTAWAAGSPLIINGRVATLWASPASTELLFVNENLLSGDDVPFEVVSATKLSQPMRSFWGDYLGLWFGCGDPDNPGTLYWTHGNNPEAARDRDTLLATPPSEPLLGGGLYNTFPFVFSSEQFYQILVSQSPDISRVRVIRTPCGRGSWTSWSFCVGPEGVFFLADDGVYITNGGSPAVSLSDPDLRSIFPKDGVPGVSINGIEPPDMTAEARLRLSYVAGFVYFDYLGLDGDDHTLIFDVSGKRWFYDETAVTGIRVRIEEPGEHVFNQILGGGNGQLYQYDESAIQDAGVDLDYDIWTNLFDGGQPRVTKQFGDIAISIDPQASVGGIGITPIINDATLLAGETVGTAATGRTTYVLDLESGGGQIARNLGLRISGTLGSSDTGRPLFYLWEPAFLFKGDDIERRATDWDALGYMGTKFVQGMILRANTFGEDKDIVVQKDGAVAAIALTINHDGEITKEYPRESQAEPGWPPFITQMVRIIGSDDVAWQMLDVRFVFEPHPELATQWETQFTSHDLKGYFSVRDAVIAHCSEGNIRLRVIYDDGVTTDYTILASGGTDMASYTRTYLPLVGRKGIAVQYQLRSGCPFRLFKRDCSVRVGPWGSTETYLQTIPFGGMHRADGAAI